MLNLIFVQNQINEGSLNITTSTRVDRTTDNLLVSKLVARIDFSKNVFDLVATVLSMCNRKVYLKSSIIIVVLP